MLEIITRTITTLQKYWVLTLLTVIIHVIASFQTMLDLKNFGVTLLIMIPVMLIGVYDFALMKFIAELNSNRSKNVLTDVWSEYLKLVPELFFRLIGAALIFGIIMGSIAGVVQYFFGSLNIETTKSGFTLDA